MTIGLVSFGLVMLYSASSVVADAAQRSSSFFLIKQSMWAAVGLLVMLAIARCDYRRLKKPWLVYGLAALSLGLLVAVLFAPPLKNAHRWLRLGLLSFQPSELSKLVLVVVLAYQLDRRKERLADFFSGMFAPFVTTGLFAYLVLIEPDYSTAACIMMIGLGAIFLSGAPMRHLIGPGAVITPLLVWLVQREDYRRQRVLAFLNPFDDPLGSGFQIIQSSIAIGAGGIFGLGFMRSQQKHFYLPEPHSDFIFAVIGEELGLLGALALVIAFTVVLWRGFVISSRAHDMFGALLASGLTILIVGQAFINIGVTLGILPTTGIPLPFVSSGGTSLVVMMASVGLLLSVSQHAR